MNQLVIHKDDENRLLKTANVLNDSVLDKYRVAGQISETAMKAAVDLINQMYHFKTQEIRPISELCLIIDSLMTKMLNRVYVKCENSISSPTCFNVNEILKNYSPELDDKIEYFKEGDVITIQLGCSVDGYSTEISHTVVIYPAGEKPVGPLLGAKADAIAANYYIKEVITSLLGLSLTPEKIPPMIQQEFGSGKITGRLLRSVVESIAESFNCRIVPGSEIRVVRRFLSGQNELLQEKGYKGLKWDELDQERFILKKLGVENTTTQLTEDEFIVQKGEVYQINITVAGIQEFEDLGIITTEEINKFTGLNNKADEFKMESSIFVRDFIIKYQLKLKNSRSLLGKIDKDFSVYPFKLSYLSEDFPLKTNSSEEIAAVKKSINESKFGSAEIVNHNLVNSKPIRILKYLPIKRILDENTISYKDVNPLKLIKHENVVTSKSTEQFTLIINDLNNEIIQLTNNFNPCYCKSDYKLQNEIIDYLLKILGDKFGVKTKKVKPLVVDIEGKEMDMD